MFQVIKNFSTHLTYVSFGLFCNFLVNFGYIWGEIVFLKGLVKFIEMGKLEDLMLFYN